jgi:protein-tyrosine phosphatase
MPPEIPAPLRWLALDGPVNFRDLGGYRTTDGREVRHGLVFRADSLHTMTDEDVRRVVDEHGVGVVVDLRTAAEVDLIGVGPIRDAVGNWHNVSIFDETQRARDADSAPTTMADEYVAMLGRTSSHFVRVLDIMATAADPAVFHCAAGKDRTGLIAALLLHVLGVDDETIAADYALTQHVMPTLRQRFIDRVTNPRFASLYGDRSEWEPRMNRAMESRPDTMLSVLNALSDRFGSAGEWLLESGLAGERIESLRARLLH